MKTTTTDVRCDCCGENVTEHEDRTICEDGTLLCEDCITIGAKS